MKKIIALLLSLIMMFTFVACSSSNNSSKDDDSDDKKTVEKADEKDESKDEEDVEAEDEDVEFEDEEAIVDDTGAYDTIVYCLDLLLDPESDECISFITNGEGIVDEEEALIYGLFASSLNCYEYSISSSEIDEDFATFEVDIIIPDAEAVMVEFADFLEMVEEDPELAEEFVAELGDIDEYSEEMLTVGIIMAILEDPECPVTATTVELYLDYSSVEGEGWLTESVSDTLLETILFDLIEEMENFEI